MEIKLNFRLGAAMELDYQWELWEEVCADSTPPANGLEWKYERGGGTLVIHDKDDAMLFANRIDNADDPSPRDEVSDPQQRRIAARIRKALDN